MPSMTKTPVDVYKYIYVSELVLEVIWNLKAILLTEFETKCNMKTE